LAAAADHSGGGRIVMTISPTLAAALLTAGNKSDEGVRYLADLTTQTGVSLQGVILAICGTVLGALIGIRALAAWAEDKHGKMATLILAGAVVAGFCYFPAESMEMLKSLYSSATSGSTPAPPAQPPQGG
jgi:hypothetical protein